MKRPAEGPSFRTELGKRRNGNVVRFYQDDVQRRWSVLLLVLRAIRLLRFGAHLSMLRRLESCRRGLKLRRDRQRPHRVIARTRVYKTQLLHRVACIRYATEYRKLEPRTTHTKESLEALPFAELVAMVEGHPSKLAQDWEALTGDDECVETRPSPSGSARLGMQQVNPILWSQLIVEQAMVPRPKAVIF